jgi:PAS domain S-box-containing protein
MGPYDDQGRYKKTLFALAIIFAGAGVLFFLFFYREAQHRAIQRLNEEQAIYAKQASRGIEEFFAGWTQNLQSLSRMKEVVEFDAVGQRTLQLFYEAHQGQIMGVGRNNERGIIIYGYPDASGVGVDISAQPHMRQFMRDQQPLITDVIKTRYGFDAIAVVVPVFRGAEFKGGVANMVNFEKLAQRYLEVIKIGETGSAWVISRDGTVLYNPEPGYVGKSVYEFTKDSPSLLGMVNDMLAGHAGVATYTSDRIRGQTVSPTTKYAVYQPIRLGNTYWSIAVTTAEQDVLAGLASFRNKLAIGIGAMFIGALLFAALGVKAWLIVKEEAKLQESERRLSLATDAAKLGIWIRDLVRNEIWATDRWRALSGFSKLERIDLEGYLQKLHPEDREAVRQTFTKAVESDGQYETEYRVVLPDGQLRWLASSGRVEFNGSGKAVRVRGAVADITSRKQAESNLHHQRAEIAHSSRLITVGELTASIAHEINQPLGAILINAGAAELLLERSPPRVDEVRQILADIRMDDLRASEVIRRVRQLSRKREMELAPLDVNSTISDVLRLIANDARRRAISLETDLRPGLPLVPGDKVHLQQVLINLAVNGMDAMSGTPEAKRRLVVRTTAENGSVEISVMDAGHGIPPEQLPNVFDSYFSTRREGVGLGLSIARSIIEAHHGRIWAENNPAGGATFRFTLPNAPPAPEPAIG